MLRTVLKKKPGCMCIKENIDQLLKDKTQIKEIHAEYGECKCSILIDSIELLSGNMPNRQLKMLMGWSALSRKN